MTARLVVAVLVALAAVAALARMRARARRCYVRLAVEPYRTDRGRGPAMAAALDTLHALLRRPAWRRLLEGQPSLALELRVEAGPRARLAIVVPAGQEGVAQAALRGAYANLVLRPGDAGPASAWAPPGALLRLRKQRPFIERTAVVDAETLDDPPVDRLLTVMAAAAAEGGQTALLQLALTPAPDWFERLARRKHERRERTRSGAAAPSQVAQLELQGGLELLHRRLFFADVRIAAADRTACRRVAAELGGGAENRLVARIGPRCGPRARRRLERGEANPLPDARHGVLASNELAVLWHLPSVGFSAVPVARGAVPVAPAPPAIMRPPAALALLHDEQGPVTIEPALRRLNTAVVGGVDQGKSSYLLSSLRADLCRPDCAVVLLDPKGDAADAAVCAVPDDRVCTLLDLAAPTCGFEPLAVRAAPDAVADGVVAALRQLFDEGDIRASSDRYLRNAIIAVLAFEREPSLWDVARLLAVTDEGRAYRARVAAALLGDPQYAEVAAFFATELGAQLADARATTTAKLDAPANKLARLLNSASVKRVLLNRSLRIDLEALLAQGEVLIVKGALGEVGAGNVSVLMQLIVGALDAALARQQDRREPGSRATVALKIDEASLVINAAFAQTLALKRSAGLETVAAWQTDAQWPPELREQLDALFAHRVYFATPSAQDARAGAGAMLDEYSDQLRAGAGAIAQLADPDVRLHLPRHYAVASWTTHEGRQRPFVARTVAFGVDRARLAARAEAQRARGARPLASFERPHWDSAPGDHGGPDSRAAPANATPSQAPTLPPAELRALDCAASGRLVRPVAAPTGKPGAEELALLQWLAAAGWALTTQIHRRHDPGRALTTTQRRLKRLADAGLIDRVQLHGGDGGGAPMCCAVSRRGRELLGERRPPQAPPPGDRDGRLDPGALALIVRRVHLLGWLLALERTLGGALLSVRGPRRFRIDPPPGVRTLADLRLESGRTPCDFPRRPFGAVTPLAAAEIALAAGGRAQLLVDVAQPATLAATLERYDQMLSGWWTHGRPGEPPRVAFVCADAGVRADGCRIADTALRAAHAYPGEAPAAWPHPGRERIVFVEEGEIHGSSLRAWRAPGRAVELVERSRLKRGSARARWS